MASRNKINFEKIKDKRVVMLQSGGLDSNILASIFHKEGFEIHSVFINYGQNSYENEKKCVKDIIDKYSSEKYPNILHEVSLDLPWLSESTSLVNGEVNDNDVGSYYLNTLDTGVYVPMRNAMFLAIAGSLCESLGIRYIACAFDGAETKITRVPLSGSPDKHPLFVDKMQSALTEGSSLKWSKHKNIKILTPLMDMFKPEIIKKGLEYNADMSLSWSCYNSTEKPCCHCSACRNRIQAFEKLGLKDPVLVKFGL